MDMHLSAVPLEPGEGTSGAGVRGWYELPREMLGTDSGPLEE